LDAFSREAVVFEHCYSTSTWTLPSFATLYTGRLPYDHGAIGGKYVDLGPDLPTLAEVFSLNGFSAEAYVAVDWLSEECSMNRGFGKFHSFLEGPVTGRHRQYQERVLNRLSEPSGQPYFLFVHYYDIHDPYDPPAPYDSMYYNGNPYDPDEQSIEVIYSEANRIQIDPQERYRWLKGVTDLEYPMKQYAAGVTYIDHVVGEVLDRLREIGLFESSVVIVTADHGEHLTEHSIYFAHRFPYEECLHVPLMIRMPDSIPYGSRIDEDVSLMDLLPTLVDFYGFEFPGVLEGSSLMSLLRGEGEFQRSLLFSEYGPNLKNQARAVWDPGFRLIHFRIEGDEWYELYDRTSDPKETLNVLEKHPREYRKLKTALDKRFPAEWPILADPSQRGNKLSEDALKRLRELGYIN
jgi:arylsulfatase A-like enzyme